MPRFFSRSAAIVALAALLAHAAPAADPIRHTFLATGGETFIVDPAGKATWSYPHSSRDGWVLENGHVLLALSKSKAHPGGAVVEVDRAGKVLFQFAGTQSEVNTVQPLPVGRVLLTEAGAKPRILEVDRAGRVVAEVPLRAQTKDHHLQTRMTRKLASGHYLVPQLLDRVVREYDPAGKVVWEVKTPHMPFTAIRLPDGRRGLRALDLATGREPVRFAPPVPPAETYGLAEGLVVTADGRRAAAVVSDGTAVVWDLSRAALVAAGPIDLRKLWEDLGTADAVRAWRAVWRLAEAPPGRLVPFLRERLKPLTPADEAAVRKLVAGLDADHFAAREEASKALLRRGRGAAPLLRGLPRPSRSPEARRRLRAVLDELGRQPPTPGVARAARAIAALGQVRAPAARRLLGELVNGAGGGPWTRETKELPWRASIVQDGTARIAVGVWPSEAARCGACPDRLYSAAGDPSPRSESCER